MNKGVVEAKGIKDIFNKVTAKHLSNREKEMLSKLQEALRTAK